MTEDLVRDGGAMKQVCRVAPLLTTLVNTSEPASPLSLYIRRELRISVCSHIQTKQLQSCRPSQTLGCSAGAIWLLLVSRQCQSIVALLLASYAQAVAC